MTHSPYFSVSGMTSLDTLKAGDRIHVIGVCGVAMAQLAILLAQKGFQVSGSDKEFYEPMGSLLVASSVKLCKGYAAQNIPHDAALVVIGNAVSYGHPEVAAVEERKLPYSIFPRLLNELVIKGRHSIVVAGTHGKTTTTALCATALLKIGAEPSYFIGGAVNELETSLMSGSGKFCVVEGDEYDSSFFAKVPKFRFYSADTVILTSVEFDHADIYSDLSAVKEQFNWLVNSLPSSGRLICCLDDENISGMLPAWRKQASCSIITYGKSEDADYCLVKTHQSEGFQEATVSEKSGKNFSFELPSPGDYNALNALAVLVSLEKCGFELKRAAQAVETFKGVKRRQEVRFRGPVTLIEDFAHHPTAVRETLAGVRKWFPASRLVAVFEPRSNTSRRKIFQKDYVEAFKTSDLAVVCNVEVRSIDANQELLDVSDLSSEIALTGPVSRCFPDADQIFTFLSEEIREGDVIVVMSNGSFGGLPARLEEHLRQRWHKN